MFWVTSLYFTADLNLSIDELTLHKSYRSKDTTL